MGKAAEPTAYPAAQLGQPHARVSDPDEVARMIVAERHAGGRLAERDALLIMMTYRHGFRASELIGCAGIRSI
jgi:integrase